MVVSSALVSLGIYDWQLCGGTRSCLKFVGWRIDFRLGFRAFGSVLAWGFGDKRFAKQALKFSFACCFEQDPNTNAKVPNVNFSNSLKPANKQALNLQPLNPETHKLCKPQTQCPVSES